MQPDTQAKALAELAKHLRQGNWNDLRSPQEMADLAADMIDKLASRVPAQDQPRQALAALCDAMERDGDAAYAHLVMDGRRALVPAQATPPQEAPATHSLGAPAAPSGSTLQQPAAASAAILSADADGLADALRFRWLCQHPDWHFIEYLCREFVADSAQSFLRELRRVIDARRSVELSAFEQHMPVTARGIDSGEAGETRSGSPPKGQEPGHEVTRPEEVAQEAPAEPCRPDILVPP